MTGEFPVTDDVAARALALPMHAGLSDADVTFVVDRVKSVLAAEGK